MRQICWIETAGLLPAGGEDIEGTMPMTLAENVDTHYFQAP